MKLTWTTPTAPAEWAVWALAVLIGLVGVTLLVGGVWLMALGGAWFYAAAGALLVASAVYLACRQIEGAWIYAIAVALTVVWSLFEVGLDGWALVPRLVGPVVLMLLVILTLPVLAPAEGRRWTLLAVGGWLGAMVIGSFVIAQANAPAPPAPMPAAATAIATTNASAAHGDWPTYGGTYAATRFTTLGAITPANVNSLERAWSYNTGDVPDEKFGAETTPIEVAGTLYLCSARNILIALDATNGDEKWRYDPQVSDENIPYTAACRGVSYFEMADNAATGDCATRIIEGTLDARLIAVDARTGIPCADFGEGGEVDITRGMGPVIPGMVSITSPPAIVRGVIVTGHQVLDGQKLSAPSGVIQGYDAVTGDLRWAWDMTNPDWDGAPPAGETYTRGTPNMWTTPTGDPELGLVYLPMGNSAVDYWSGSRTAEEDTYTAALVAIDVSTGKPRWHFRTVNVDVWDYDLGSQPTLIDFPSENGATPALVLASKQGEIYVLDRATGTPLVHVDNRPVPQGGVEPERRASEQRFSTYHTLRKPDLVESDMWGMSLIDQMICRIQFRQAEYKGIYTPPTTETHWIQYPGYNGGSDWGGIAVDPQRGVIVANYNDMPNFNRLVPRAEADRLGWSPRGESSDPGGGAEGAGDPQAGAPYAIDVNAGWRMGFTGLLCKQPPYGGIRAIELATGRTIWDRPFGTARKNGPFGLASGLPLTIGTPNNGGAALTGSGLIFIAAATDDLIRAIDIRTGETVWTDALPAGGQANPIIYEAGGREFIVIVAGGHHFMETPPGDHVIAYTLRD